MGELKVFKYHTTAKPSDIDILNHVNNEVYLRWLMESAIAHSDHLGFPVSEYTKIGSAFVVRRHEIDYLSSALLNDEVVIETWCGEIGGTKAVREYQILRSSDHKILIQAKSLFVFIDLSTGRPKQIPDDLIKIFAQYKRV